MTILYFEDLVIWKLSRELVADIYKFFKENKDYDFKSQIRRAAISVMNNIAEGFDRSKQSNDNKQFVYFLTIAYGSCGEVKSMLYIAEDLGYIDIESAVNLKEKTTILSSKISGLIAHLQQNERPQQINKSTD